jgi:UDP-N-acetylglucosamine 2-epimerase (non-hydrolysing)
VLVHTGQHYTENMSKAFFEEFDIPMPDINLGVGSASHAQQTAEIMKTFEPVILEHKPDAVLVVGDVNSTVAAAIVAAKLGVRVIHVEAGLRSFDSRMPEEINRVLTDAISDILFVSEPSGLANLKHEGVDEKKVYFVGNVMIDTLEYNKARADRSTILEDMGLTAGKYVVVTLHRPSNVDDKATLVRIFEALAGIQSNMRIVFPIHPRTRNNLKFNGLGTRLESLRNITLTDPLGYLSFLKLMSKSKLVITDSGGIQEETTILGIPCLTTRENTERPITITEGTNILVGTNTDMILEGYQKSLNMTKPTSRPELWDGKASERIVQVLLDTL